MEQLRMQFLQVSLQPRVSEKKKSAKDIHRDVFTGHIYLRAAC